MIWYIDSAIQEAQICSTEANLYQWLRIFSSVQIKKIH